MFRRSQLIIPALLAALTLIFFYELAFTDRILARGDTFAYFYPYWAARDAALRAGTLPLWSPDIFAGVPLLANSQIGTFYPPNWLTITLDPPTAIKISILLHVWWAALGVYTLARASLGVSRVAALAAAAIFAFGGHIGGHIEQINQLQGLAWLPWGFWVFHKCLTPPPNPFPEFREGELSQSGLAKSTKRRWFLHFWLRSPFTKVRNSDRADSPPRIRGGDGGGVILLAITLALQFFTGHTQTVFITGIGLGIYALCQRPIRGLITLALAGFGALILTAPQLIPTLEMSSVSNRRGGLNVNQATAFSFSPFVTGRGLLPSFDRIIFSEYIAYPGIVGWGLAIIGALSGLKLARPRLPLSPRVTWLIIALVGLALAYGLYNPLYWWLGSLPGFNLFRVPARWLALFALGGAMLAALGVDALMQIRIKRWYYAVIIILVLLLIVGAVTLTDRNPDLTPVTHPETITIAGWMVTLVVTVTALAIVNRVKDRRALGALTALLTVELFIASHVLAYHQLVPPEIFSGQRFTVSQMLAFNADETPPGRVLSISQNFFDPGDRAALEARYRALGMSDEEIALAFDGIKKQELLAANLPLAWGIPSFDGFDGGVLPTAYYTAFTSLMLPEGELRTVDGRLREILSRPGVCDGGCIPDRRWLELAHIEYLITDKIFDLVHESVFYDTSLPFVLENGATITIPNAESADPLPANEIHVLCAASCDLRAGDTPFDAVTEVGGYTLLTAPVDPTAASIPLTATADAVIQAVTLVNTEDETFQQVAPPGYTRALSSDIKLYQLDEMQERAFLAYNAVAVADDDYGTETALILMRGFAFDFDQTVILSTSASTEDIDIPPYPLGLAESTLDIETYTAERERVNVFTEHDAYLVLKDAYYPGWTVTVNGEPANLYRADVMFRAVRVPAGNSVVEFAYRPSWLPLNLIIGAVGWLVALGVLIVSRRRNS